MVVYPKHGEDYPRSWSSKINCYPGRLPARASSRWLDGPDRLDRGAPARLTLVIGSPGAGKTVRLADSLASHPERPEPGSAATPLMPNR